MTITLAFLTLLMAALLGWLFWQSWNTQPWIPATAGADAHRAMPAQPAAKTALWTFLAVATSLFALFVSAYAMRITYLDWSPLPRPRLLMLNTAILVAASVAVECAALAARRGNVAAVRKALWVVGALSAAFLAGQAAVWMQLRDAGFFVATSAATGFFYLLTAAHGAHVIGGLVGWARTSLRAWRDGDPARVRIAVEMCAIYWHFLLVAWIVLFAVLASNRLGLAICGPDAL